jgi:hypothetical protein
VVAATVTVVTLSAQQPADIPTSATGAHPLSAPNDRFFGPRTTEDGTLPLDAFNRAADEARALRLEATTEDPELAAPAWEPIGPTNVQGRIQGIAVDPVADDVVYIGSGARPVGELQRR